MLDQNGIITSKVRKCSENAKVIPACLVDVTCLADSPKCFQNEMLKVQTNPGDSPFPSPDRKTEHSDHRPSVSSSDVG